MNHNCLGDFFERHGEWWYRCLRDNHIEKTAMRPGALDEGMCPHCKRPRYGTWHPTENRWQPDASPEVALQVDLPSLTAERDRLRGEVADLQRRLDAGGMAMRTISCDEALRRARALLSGKDRTDCEYCGIALIDGQLAICESCLRESPVRLTQWVETVLSARYADDPNAIAYATRNAITLRGPVFARALAASLLRAADTAEAERGSE